MTFYHGEASLPINGLVRVVGGFVAKIPVIYFVYECTVYFSEGI